MKKNDPRVPDSLLYRMPVALRWRDLDAFNHVNNATFLTYLEEARIRWFDSLDGPWLSDAIAPLMAAVHINYRQPIDYPAGIAVELTAERVGNTSLTVGHRIVGDGDDVLHADGHVVLVWIDRANGRPVVLPDVIRKAVNA
jgi:acyl-CoA thioester hydrolase